MEKRLLEALENRTPGEYILPFFWQHGEAHDLLLDELEAIRSSGIREFCVESRTHEQFCEEKWWEDFGFLLEEARKREMRVWLLDDKRFPTGFANNYIASHPELRAVRVRLEPRDFIGPKADAALVPSVLWGEEESLVAAVAYRRAGGDRVFGKGIPLLPKQKDGLIWWDIPEGNWRVYYVIRTRRSPVEGKKNYIDMLSEESCRAMLHAVYEPHYLHFQPYFENTFAGFFSDEPGFGNEGGTYHSTLGRETQVLPWSDDLPEIMAEKTGRGKEEILALLPALWHEIENETPAIRESYMEAVTEKFSRCFSWTLGNWCRAHNVQYIGHVIEDDNAHQRLGHGCGHYFRALAGQDMGGIDIVLHQYVPGIADMEHIAWLEEKRADPAFFRYTLPKLASSHAHIQPLKKGRAVCEIFGGFGWAEGVPEMKQITDLMLVSGINHFVPHAFTARYPDRDLPPHFYARGMNPQYPVFGKLMEYTHRMSHVLSGGIHQADVAVYYNAEAEWAGGKCQLQQEVCKALCRGQVEFDIVPQDTVCGDMQMENGLAVVHKVRYGALIVPYSQYLPQKVLTAFSALAEDGLPIWFIDGAPTASSEGKSLERLPKDSKVVPLDALVSALSESGLKRFRTEKPCPTLRYFHTSRDGYDIVMLWNESITEEIDTRISLPVHGDAIIYDGWKNELRGADQNEGSIRVRLAPAESMVLCFGNWQQTFPPLDYRDNPRCPFSAEWRVSLKTTGTEDYLPYGTFCELRNLAHELPSFCGTIRYETELHLDDPESCLALEFEDLGETAELWVNGVSCGTVVGKPYRFDLRGKVCSGKNSLCVDVVTNLGYRERDMLSSFLPLPTCGLRGTATLEWQSAGRRGKQA